MRSAIPIFLAILAFATTPARAQGTWLETRMILPVGATLVLEIGDKEPFISRPQRALPIRESV